ncbi:MAG TPA: ComEC/Rec2 family competence protein, partial [Bacillota bacterium]|nr:ComEC/Rec2 family competence protein [Bacillota bacterium]
LVAGFFVALGRRLGWRTGITYWSTIAGVLIYSLISGLSPPVIRSAVMAGLGLYALLFNQRRSWPVALGLAGIVTTINRPEVILEPGYQLSFAATWAILTLTKDLTHLLRNIPRGPLWLGTGIAVPLAAQLGTWPLLAYHFNQFAPWSLLANLLLVEVAGLMLLLGLFMAILALVSYQAAAILQWGLGLLTSLFIGSANWLAGLPGGVISLPSPPLWSIVSYYLLLLMAGTSQGRFLLQRSWKLWLFHRPNARPVLLTSAGLAGVLLLVIITGSYREPGLQVTFLDVGEGDSIFIRTPGGRSLLIDAGPVQLNREGKVIYDAGARAVLPFLRSQGVNHLDLVIISHLHRDHVGGLPEVVQHIKVDNLLLPPLTGDSPEEKSIRRLALTNQIKLLQGQEGQRVNLDQAVELSILGPWEELISPAQAEADREQRLNNQSLVLQLAYGKHNYLFTGDIDSAVLEKLADNKKLGRLTLLKLPHHGSGYSLSTSFLEVTRPELGVISVGPNYYGHPSSKVLRYFQDTGIPLLRTDKQGALHISDFGGELKVITFNSPEG